MAGSCGRSWPSSSGSVRRRRRSRLGPQIRPASREVFRPAGSGQRTLAQRPRSSSMMAPGRTMPEGRWAVGSNQHRKRASPDAPEPSVNLAARDDGRRELTHVTWDDTRVDVSRIRPSDVDRALARFRSQLPKLVWNAAALEGNTYTLDGVRALLEGVSVAGKPLDDERQILALSEAYSLLDQLLADRAFHLDKGTSDSLHAILARHEALDAGLFRGEGTSTGGGHVRLSDGSVVEGADAGPPRGPDLLPRPAPRRPPRRLGVLRVRDPIPVLLRREQAHGPPDDDRASDVRRVRC